MKPYRSKKTGQYKSTLKLTWMVAVVIIVLLVLLGYLQRSNNALEANLERIRKDYVETTIHLDALFEDTVARSRGIDNQEAWEKQMDKNAYSISSLTPAEREILRRESNFRVDAKNPHSTARGMWQCIEVICQKYYGILGINPHTKVEHEQIKAFRLYVKSRYQTAENALAFHESNGWY